MVIKGNILTLVIFLISFAAEFTSLFLYQLIHFSSSISHMCFIWRLPILAILFRPFGLLASKTFIIIWLINLSTLSVPDESYSRHALCALILIYTVLLDNNHHGTRCAGEIAAVANSYCAVGVAYHAKVSGEITRIILWENIVDQDISHEFCLFYKTSEQSLKTIFSFKLLGLRFWVY